MPVEFLSAEQARRYGRYAGEPSAAQLTRYFHLDDADRALIAGRWGAHNQLGLALQLGTVRFLGTFLPEPTAVPAGVVAHVAAQLGISDPQCQRRYRRAATHSAHAEVIRQQYGYRAFTDQPEHFRLVRWLLARVWLSPERPSVLFDLATAYLVDHKILLPGVSILARLVTRVCDRANVRLWRRLASLPSREQRTRLEGLLATPTGARPR